MKNARKIQVTMANLSQDKRILTDLMFNQGKVFWKPTFDQKQKEENILNILKNFLNTGTIKKSPGGKLINLIRLNSIFIIFNS